MLQTIHAMIGGEPEGALRQFTDSNGITIHTSSPVIAAKGVALFADHAAATKEANPQAAQRIHKQAADRAAGHGRLMVVGRQLTALIRKQPSFRRSDPNATGAVLGHGVHRRVRKTDPFEFVVMIADQSFLHADPEIAGAIFEKAVHRVVHEGGRVRFTKNRETNPVETRQAPFRADPKVAVA